VRRFYQVIWEAHDKSAIPPLLHPEFTFRGSLGQRKQGHRGFVEYVDMVHQALGDYRCSIQEMVEEDNKVFAKVMFGGIHKGTLLGYEASGKRVEWIGCALFAFDGDLISDLWVLGDLRSLAQQLERNKLGAAR